jgi:type 1 fimbria pilin
MHLQEVHHHMKRTIAIALSTAAALAGFAAPASAEPIVTVCGSVQVTVNGSDVVNNATCQVLPPESR